MVIELFEWLGRCAFILFGVNWSFMGNLKDGDYQRLSSSTTDTRDFFIELPGEVIKYQIIARSRASTILLLSMTSKSYQSFIIDLFKDYYSDKQDVLYDELIAVKEDKRLNLLLRQAMIMTWPTSKNCMESFYLKDALYALLQNASTGKKKISIPIPFIHSEKDFKGRLEEHRMVPNNLPCAILVLKYKTFKKARIHPELLSEVPNNVLSGWRGSLVLILDDKIEIPKSTQFLERLDLIVPLFHYAERSQLPMVMLHKLLMEGLDACLDFISRKDLYFNGLNFEPVLKMMLDLAQPSQIQKMSSFAANNISGIYYRRTLCTSGKLEMFPREISPDSTFGEDPFSIRNFVLMIDGGLEPSEDWLVLSKFDADSVLASYNEETKRFECSADLVNETVWFVALVRELDDERLVALLDLLKFPISISPEMLLLALQFEKNEAVISKIIKEVSLCSGYCVRKSDYPLKIDIPLKSLPKLVTRCYSGRTVLLLIPDETKLIDALRYIDSNGLWRGKVNPVSILSVELDDPRPKVVHLLLDMAFGKDLNLYSSGEIFVSETVTHEQHCILLEYLMGVPTKKLLKALMKKSPEDLSDASTMLPFITRVLRTRPDRHTALNFRRPEINLTKKDLRI